MRSDVSILQMRKLSLRNVSDQKQTINDKIRLVFTSESNSRNHNLSMLPHLPLGLYLSRRMEEQMESWDTLLKQIL